MQWRIVFLDAYESVMELETYVPYAPSLGEYRYENGVYVSPQNGEARVFSSHIEFFSPHDSLALDIVKDFAFRFAKAHAPQALVHIRLSFDYIV